MSINKSQAYPPSRFLWSALAPLHLPSPSLLQAECVPTPPPCCEGAPPGQQPRGKHCDPTLEAQTLQTGGGLY